jgi:hypothetical protein
VQKTRPEQLFLGLAVELTVGAVDESERAAGLEPADQVGLVFHDGAQTPLALGHGLFGSPALGCGRRQQHVRNRQDANIAADQHQAFPFAVSQERPAPAQERVDRQHCDKQGAGGCPALAET